MGTLFRSLLAAATACFLAGMLVASQGCVNRDTSPSSPQQPGEPLAVFDTQAWRQPGALSMRYAPDGSLLIAHAERDTVYRYVREEARLEAVGHEAWEAAEGAVSECDVQGAGLSQEIRIDRETNRLLIEDRTVPTAGSVVLNVRPSPDDRLLAVLSAEGPRVESPLPHLGRGGARGVHYHEVVALPNGLPVGSHTALPFGGPDEVLEPCWSPDAQYVIYTDILRFRLAVAAGTLI